MIQLVICTAPAVDERAKNITSQCPLKLFYIAGLVSTSHLLDLHASADLDFTIEARALTGYRGVSSKSASTD